MGGPLTYLRRSWSSSCSARLLAGAGRGAELAGSRDWAAKWFAALMLAATSPLNRAGEAGERPMPMIEAVPVKQLTYKFQVKVND